jgi:hypothetical protein
MKRMMGAMIAFGLAATVVSGCQSSGGGGSNDGLITRTQEIARDVCLFEPDAGPIQAILNLGNPNYHTSVQVAQGICEAVLVYQPKGGGPLPAGATPQVQGIAVTGSFIRR